jgi:hypothetical protein
VAEQLRQLRGKIAAELSGLRKPGSLIVAVAGLAAAAAFFVQSGRLADARRELQQVKARLPELGNVDLDADLLADGRIGLAFDCHRDG